jgi:hypothetical protein
VRFDYAQGGVKENIREYWWKSMVTVERQYCWSRRCDLQCIQQLGKLQVTLMLCDPLIDNKDSKKDTRTF